MIQAEQRGHPGAWALRAGESREEVTMSRSILHLDELRRNRHGRRDMRRLGGSGGSGFPIPSHPIPAAVPNVPGDCRTGRAIPETFAAARPVDRTPVTPEAKQDLDAKHEPQAGGAARVATFKLIDLDGDITLPGALGRQEVRLAAWGHDWGGAVVGRGATRETSEAALFGGASSLDTSHARETYPAVNRPGNLQAWSYRLQIDVVTGRRPNAGQTPGRATDASSPQLLRATGFRDRLDPANRGRASRAGGRAALYRAAAIGVNISTPANRLEAENLVTVVPSTASSLQVEQLPIDALPPDPINPRRISEDELAALTRSIEMFGFVDSVLARCADRRVIAGPSAAHRRTAGRPHHGACNPARPNADRPARDGRSGSHAEWLRGGRSPRPADPLRPAGETGPAGAL